MSNFTSIFFGQAKQFPDKPALVIPDYSQWKQLLIKEKITFQSLSERVKKYAAAWQNEGFQPGDRIIILLPVSINLYALVLAATAIGAIPVLINPGLSKSVFFHCMRQVKAKGIISDHQLMWFHWFIPALSSIPKKYCLESKIWSIKNLQKLSRQIKLVSFQPVDLSAEHSALITFTSGSSGTPKGVNRTHNNLIHQHLALKAEFPPLKEQVDLPAFPVLTLHNLCCGTSTIMPLIRFNNISQVNVPLLLEQINNWQINTLSGPPTYLKQIASYCLRHQITVPSIQGLAIGGAPVETWLCRELLQIFPEAETYIIYGSSEAEPIASISFREFIQTEKQRHLGYCVGHKASTIKVAFLQVTSPPENNQPVDWEARLCLPGDCGEIIVSGEHVCKSYFANPAADKQYKLTDKHGNTWHRTGDIGFEDTLGRIWLVGRQENGFMLNGKIHYPFSFERVVQHLQEIPRAAVVAIHNQLIICVEGREVHTETEVQIKALMQDFFNCSDIYILPFAKLPVDARHQSKINYPLLQQQVKAQLKR